MNHITFVNDKIADINDINSEKFYTGSIHASGIEFVVKDDLLVEIKDKKEGI